MGSVIAPLERVMGLVDLFVEDNLLDETGKVYANYLRSAAEELDSIIQDMVRKASAFSRGHGDDDIAMAV